MAVEMGTPSVVAGAAFDRNLTAGSAANPLKVSRGDRIRTCDLVLPKHPRYQAAPRPVLRHCNGVQAVKGLLLHQWVC